MTRPDWWLPSLNPAGLSQGDLVADVVQGTAWDPIVLLGRDAQTKGSNKLWPQVDKFSKFKTDSSGLFVGRGVVTRALVVSHNCEIDKGPGSPKVLVAPVFSISKITDDAARASIMAGARRAFMPLPAPDVDEDYYADFRQINYVLKGLLPDERRLFSMTDDGVLRVKAQLVEFFTRVKFPAEVFGAKDE